MIATAAHLNDSDPRVRRTRRLLLDAFTDLQKEKSLNAISVQDITGRATVNRATFYAHFEDKYALMDCWIREEFRRVLAEILPAPRILTVSNLRALIRAVFDFLDDFYSSCKRSDTQFEPMFETAMQQELREILGTWLRHRQPPAGQGDEASEVTAQVVSWAIFGPAVQWSRGPRTQSAEEISREVQAVVMAALTGVIGSIPKA